MPTHLYQRLQDSDERAAHPNNLCRPRETVSGDRAGGRHQNGNLEQDRSGHGDQKEQIIHGTRLVDVRERVESDESDDVGNDQASTDDEVGYQVAEVVLVAVGRSILQDREEEDDADDGEPEEHETQIDSYVRFSEQTFAVIALEDRVWNEHVDL